MNQTDYDAIARVMWKSNAIPTDLANYFAQEAAPITTYCYQVDPPDCQRCQGHTESSFDRDRFIRRCYGTEE